jgi:hypothetical protein
MNTPANLKSAANCLIAVGFFYLLIVCLVIFLADHAPDAFGKIFAGAILGLGCLLWLSAFLLYRCNRFGKWIWWVCSPFVLLQFPIGTALGVFTYVYLNKPDSRAALSGQVPVLPPPLPTQ